MAYKTIEELLEHEEYPWEYDYKNENSNNEYIEKARNTNNQLVKFALYKRDVSFDTDGTIIKNKACNLTREIYRELFGFKDKENNNQISRYGKCDINDDEFGPETMNTAMKVLRYFCFNEFKEKLKSKFPYCPFVKNTNFSNDFLIATVLEHSFDIENEEDKNDISTYLASITNMGNYCLVPAYLNPARGLNKLKIESGGEKKKPKIIDDYFDITLFFMSTKDKDKWFYNDNGEKKEIKWDKKIFLKFINISLLWDYCIFNNEEQVYGVKKLFVGNEDFKKDTSILCDENIDCEEKKDFSKFMENVIWCIKRRGFLMILLLLLKQYNSEKYSEINESIFENKIHTMNDAINIVLSKSGLETIEDEQLMKLNVTIMHDVYNKFKQKICNEKYEKYDKS